MKQNIKNIIDRLVITDVSNVVPLGDLIVDLMFPTGQRALLIDFDSRQGWMLASQGTVSKEILQLTELLSTFKTLETQNLIYIVDDQMSFTGIHCNYAESDRCEKNEILSYVSLNKDNTLKAYYSDEAWHIKKGDKCIFNSVKIPECMFEELVRILYSRIYPTESLISYQSRGYITENEYYNQKALQYSLKSMIIACVIAVASLIFTVPISNKWGKSTITNSQFDALLHSIGEIKKTAIKDTVFAIMIKDTIVTRPITQQNSLENGQAKNK